MTDKINPASAGTSRVGKSAMEVLRGIMPLAVFAACGFAAYTFVWGDLMMGVVGR